MLPYELKEQEFDNNLMFYSKDKEFMFCFVKNMNCIYINRDCVYYINEKYDIYMDSFSDFILKIINNYYSMTVKRCLYDNTMYFSDLHKNTKHSKSAVYKKF